VINEYTFTARLAALVGIDIALTILNSFIPHDLSPVRAGIALIQLGFMAATMAVAMPRVQEDY
jgi:hypothetical protein